MAKRLPETARIVLATAVAAPIATHRATGDPSTQISHDSIAVTQSTSERAGINVIRAKRPERSGRGLSQRDASALTDMIAATRSTSAPMAISNPIASITSAAIDPSGTQNAPRRRSPRDYWRRYAAIDKSDQTQATEQSSQAASQDKGRYGFDDDRLPFSGRSLNR
jgi:hypothetical protein